MAIILLPHFGKVIAMKTRNIAIALVSALLFTGALLAQQSTAELTVAGLGDMEKITKDAPVPASPHFWDAGARRLTLHGGRNETVAAQLMLSAKADIAEVNVTIGDLKGAAGTIPADPNIALFQELYQYVSDGSYSGWGPNQQSAPQQTLVS